MASVGPQNPTAAASTDFFPFGVAAAWANPSNIYASDDTRATAAVSYTAPHIARTQDLYITGFDFSSIPSGATIDGVVVEFEKSVSSTTGTPKDEYVQLLIAGSPSGDNKATATSWPTTDAYSTYGGAADKWSLSLTEADIKHASFGLRLRGRMSTTVKKLTTTFRIDHVRITVYYTAGGGGGTVGRIVTIPMAIFAM